MPDEQRSFSIRATASRVAKGLLAIPRKLEKEFPDAKCSIEVIFDDAERAETKLYQPYDLKVKECRIYGLGPWFQRRGVVSGDVISVKVEDRQRGIYRIVLDRYVREKQTTEARGRLHAAKTAEVAAEELRSLAKISRKKTSAVAHEELLQIARELPSQYRRRVSVPASPRREGVPEGIRALLEVVHAGKCQLCSFTFLKRDGSPYFETHHLDPERGHHPANLLVVCPNCHAQFEHSEVCDFEFTSGWLVTVRIAGKRRVVRQPFVQQGSLGQTIRMLMIALRIATLGVLVTSAPSLRD